MPNYSYTAELTPEQIETLQQLLEERGWALSEAPYAVFRAKKEKVNVTAYESGKTVIQGKGTEEFIEFMYEIGLPIPEVAQEEDAKPEETTGETNDSEEITVYLLDELFSAVRFVILHNILCGKNVPC